ncbi:hypothetical protein H6F96_18230 [Microcoleus sp. FACHB-53]|nr:hypothetical protein [Microcoleus sp. FACHB-53]MBD2127131.1 hypothetical protein [Microcoleus sp. FACHB-1]
MCPANHYWEAHRNPELFNSFMDGLLEEARESDRSFPLLTTASSGVMLP